MATRRSGHPEAAKTNRRQPIVQAFDEGFEFDAMAQRPMYRACPDWLIEHCDVTDRSTVVDLGCGSGILTRLLLERFRSAPSFRVIAVDPSEWELAIARKRVRDPRVTFIQGRAQDAAAIVTNDVDAVLLCSVLHQIPVEERQPVLGGAFALVRPGGLVGANTTFYEGAIGPESRPFYLRWLLETRKVLEMASIPWRVPDANSVAHQYLTQQQHHDLFQSLGYQDIRTEVLQLEWQVEDWEALSKYSVFIQGVLWPDIDLAAGSRALIEGVRSTYRALGIDSMRRGCLFCVARRPTNAT
jgi:ubiquinone/menaquinone biosynthesis C-methylase UbiE